MVTTAGAEWEWEEPDHQWTDDEWARWNYGEWGSEPAEEASEEEAEEGVEEDAEAAASGVKFEHLGAKEEDGAQAKEGMKKDLLAEMKKEVLAELKAEMKVEPKEEQKADQKLDIQRSPAPWARNKRTLENVQGHLAQNDREQVRPGEAWITDDGEKVWTSRETGETFSIL